MICKKRDVLAMAVLMASSAASAQVFNVTTDSDPAESGTLAFATNSANSSFSGATVQLRSGLGTISIPSGALTLQNSGGISIYGDGDSMSVNDGFIVNAGAFMLGDGSGSILLNGGSKAVTGTISFAGSLLVTTTGTWILDQSGGGGRYRLLSRDRPGF